MTTDKSDVFSTDVPSITRSSDRAHRRLAWLLAGLRVAFVGGTVGASIEAVLSRRELLGQGLVWCWIEVFSFLLITHVVLGLVVCTAACLCGRLTVQFIKRLDRYRWPTPVSLAGLLVGEALMAGYWIALFIGVSPTDVPDGGTGLAFTSLAWLIGLIPTGVLCGVLGRTQIGRFIGVMGRLAVWPSIILMIAAVVMTWRGRPQIEQAEGFWPIHSIAASRGAPERPPDIVFIVFDTLRADRLGCYGYPKRTSVHIDAFAKDATLYTQAISPGSWTVPSHASMFTGLHPSQHGAHWGGGRRWLDQRFVTLAEALREHGYQTMALSNNGLVGPSTNLTQGFEQFAEPVRMGVSEGISHYVFARHILMKLAWLGPWFARWFVYDAGGRVTTALTANWLRDRDRSRPVFLFINLMEAHDPYEPPLAYRRPFVSDAESNHSYRIDQGDWTKWQYVLAGKPVYSPDDIRILSDLYDGRICEMDHHFADLMRVLASKTDLDQTLVILTSDHGEHLGEHGLLDHHFSLYNPLVHVPLILRWPKVLRPQRIEQLVQTSDLFPTILNWTGSSVHQTAEVMARPLPPDSGATALESPKYAYSEYLNWPPSPLEAMANLDPSFDASRWKVAFRSVTDGQWRLILGSGGRAELYDVVKDPGENRNLIRSDRSKADTLTRHVDRWLKSFIHFDPNQTDVPVDPALDAEQRQRLRGLGYVQ